MMSQVFSSQFLIVFFLLINVFLVLLLWVVIRRVNRLQGSLMVDPSDAVQAEPDSSMAMEKSAEILEMLESLVVEARTAADHFEEQIQEKRHLSKSLNDALDSRIISINLLLSRAKTLHEKLERQQDKLIEHAGNLRPQAAAAQRPTGTVMDQQQQIIDMYYRKKDVNSIAQALSIPKEEVRLVIELKEKFIAMEKTQ